MATGTLDGGAFRLTAARRLSVGFMAALTAAVWILAAPSVVWAADEWHRTVRFESEPCGADDNLSSTATTYSTSASTEGSPALALDENDSTRWVTDNPINGRTINVQLSGGAKAICGVRILAQANDSDGVGTHSISVQTDTNCATAGGLLVPPAVMIDPLASGGALAMVDSGVVEWEITAECFRFVASGTSNGGWRVYSIDIFADPGASVLESCAGFPGPNGDEGLIFNSVTLDPPPGLVADGLHDEGWGDIFLPNAEPVAACDFTDAGTFTYTPPEGVTEGDTHLVAADIACGEFSSGGVTFDCLEGEIAFYWITRSGGISGEFLIMEDAGPGASDGVASLLTNAPSGATALRVRIGAGTRLHTLTLANVEGNPSLDTGDDGTGPTPGPDGAGDPWANCVPGADFLAVGEWVAYAACLVAGIPGAIGIMLGSLLTTLFVPGPSLGLQWQSFIDFMETRVPFGWFAEISDNVEGSAATGASAIGALNLTIGSATVSIGGVIDDAMGGVSPYRGLIFGGVALVMGLGCLRWIMAAVGVSPGGMSSGGAD